MSSEDAESEGWGRASREATDVELGHNSVGLPMTMQALLEVLSESAPEHPLRSQVADAVECGSFLAMRAALAAWYKLPRSERDRILR